jgi:NADH dehydrogenase [ubiquinone] 1 alpha subcomplex assembly factor 7
VTDKTQNDFAARLIARIREQGPISIADYMRECNAHYYATRDPFGAAGDFTTAPEIGQVFGELIGAWCTDYWQRMGAPDPVLLVELGPGRGTLMADALRATRRVSGFHDALKLHLIEQSPVLRKLQQEKLAAYTPQFHDDVASLPPGPLLLIANEFFDALPIVQFEQHDLQWYERLVGLEGEKLTFRRASQFLLDIPNGARPENEGKVRMISPAIEKVAENVGVRLRRHRGAALVIDYGFFPSALGDTLQAVRQHKPASIFDSPGEVDITAHVDFAALAHAAAYGRVQVHGPVTQAQFLIQLGIAAREAALLKNATPDQQIAIRGACRRLIEPAEMGSLFKVLALTPPGGPMPAGFGATP